jgi:2-polyprenyl-3-methyl-5-hydroxy-6-metoxy-1,4-benzoquinol methylase
MSPLCESYISPDQLNEMERFYPLHVYVCDNCFLVQLLEYVSPNEIFSEYAYFSSYSDSWLKHAQNYTEMAIVRFGLDSRTQVVEIASNDGYLLQYFLQRGIRVLGVEPAANVAEVAERKGVPSIDRFFGETTAHELVSEGTQADLLLGNNILTHVPNINDFVKGLKILLKTHGVITMEFPHLMQLMEGNQFDTIYHEHFSYLSFITAEKIFAANGLMFFDVEEIATHGGSLRIYACHSDDVSKPIGDRVSKLRQREEEAGFTCLDHYFLFAEKVKETKRKILDFLIQTKRQGCTIVGYGAPGKGNALLNHCGIRTDFLDYVVDRNPYKHGKYLPGTHIPIYPPGKITETKPNYVLILPWNLKDEIIAQLSGIREWKGRFVVPIPEPTVYR